MIAQILKDPWTWICTVFMAAVQWIIAHGNAMMGLVVFCTAVVTFIFGFIEKRKKNRLLDIELKIKEEELRRLQSK